MRGQIVLTVCALSLPLLGGCVYWVCPKLDRTPNVNVDAAPDSVHAFRVDSVKTTGSPEFARPALEWLSEIPVTNNDEVPAQLKPSLTQGGAMIGIALNYVAQTSHSVALRIYRPGYQLVEISSWGRANKVTWKPAPDLEAQEFALRKLLPINRLLLGCKSKEHQGALLFGASEYERLAAAAQTPEQRVRLTEQANKLRELATEERLTR